MFPDKMTEQTYRDYVANWIPDITWSQVSNSHLTPQINSVILNCFENNVTSINCARYILDKYGKQLPKSCSSSNIVLNFDFGKLISGKTTFLTIGQKERWRLETIFGDKEHVALKYDKRTRGNNRVQDYKMKILSYGELNRIFGVERY